jgi:hypothetical protein
MVPSVVGAARESEKKLLFGNKNEYIVTNILAARDSAYCCKDVVRMFHLTQPQR